MRCGFLLLTGLCWWLASAAAFGQAPVGETAGERDKLQAIAEPFLEGLRICDIGRVSLVSGRPADILVSIDVNGRYFCNGVMRISFASRPRVIDYLPTWMLERIADAVVDVDADGDSELVLRRGITPYEGADCIATTPAIYECTATTCLDTGDRYKGYLAKALETVERERDETLGTNPERYREGLSCSIVAADKLRRRLGVDPRAGASIAEQWINDPDVKLRRKAVTVFEDIGDEDATRNLTILSRDRDSSVADMARMALPRK